MSENDSLCVCVCVCVFVGVSVSVVGEELKGEIFQCISGQNILTLEFISLSFAFFLKKILFSSCEPRFSFTPHFYQSQDKSRVMVEPPP